MNVDFIFKQISESRLLKNLVERGKLAFIGEQETINYLKNFFEENKKSCQYDYYDWNQREEKLVSSNLDLSKYDALVVASCENEHIIFDWVKQFIKNSSVSLPVLRLFTDIFVNMQCDRALLDSSDWKIADPKISYAIVSTPRSGSTALCELLSATKIAGFPIEHFRESSQVLTQYCQLDPVRYLRLLMTSKKTENAVFGTKFISRFLEGHINENNELIYLLKNFKFIYLIRRDKLSQVVSEFIAAKTNMWHIYSERQAQNYQDKLERLKIEDSDLIQLHKMYKNCLREEKFLENLFDRYQIFPLTVEYEKFVADPEENLNKILKYLDILERDRQIEVRNKQQYRLYRLAKSLKLMPENGNITVTWKTRKLRTSNLSKQLIERYQDRYGKTGLYESLINF